MTVGLVIMTLLLFVVCGGILWQDRGSSAGSTVGSVVMLAVLTVIGGLVLSATP